MKTHGTDHIRLEPYIERVDIIITWQNLVKNTHFKTTKLTWTMLSSSSAESIRGTLTPSGLNINFGFSISSSLKPARDTSKYIHFHPH
jgi:hypothetical protein